MKDGTYSGKSNMATPEHGVSIMLTHRCAQIENKLRGLKKLHNPMNILGL